MSPDFSQIRLPNDARGEFRHVWLDLIAARKAFSRE
jgi:hypothetical protein